MDRGAWRAVVYGVAKSWTGVNDGACMHIILKRDGHRCLLF